MLGLILMPMPMPMPMPAGGGGAMPHNVGWVLLGCCAVVAYIFQLLVAIINICDKVLGTPYKSKWAAVFALVPILPLLVGFVAKFAKIGREK